MRTPFCVLLLTLLVIPLAKPQTYEALVDLPPEEIRVKLAHVPVEDLESLFMEGIDNFRSKIPACILKVLRDRGPEAEPAIPLLIKVLRRDFSKVLTGDYIDDDTLAVLESMGPPATVALAKETMVVGFQPWNDLGRKYTPSTPDAAETHARLLHDRNEYVRIFTARVLSNMGEKGYRAVVSRLRADDPELRLAGARAADFFYEYARFLTPMLADLLHEEEQQSIRRAAARALRKMVPDGIPVMLDALDDADDEVRLIAAVGIERIFSFPPATASMKSVTGEQGAWRNRMNLHWFHEDLPSYIPSVISGMQLALTDASEDVRATAALVLFKLAPFAGQITDDLEKACNDSSSAVRYWAEAALGQIREGRWESLRLFAEKIQGDSAETNPLTEEARDALVKLVKTAPGWEFDAQYEGDLPWPNEVDQRWDAARELIRRDFSRLIVTAEGEDRKASEEAAEILDLLQWALDKRLYVLLRFLDEDWCSCWRPARDALTELREVAYPALAYDWLRCYRFPVGPSTYTELVSVIEKGGANVLPILVKGLRHWRNHEIYYAAAAVRMLGSDALPAAPALLSAWRYPYYFTTGYELFWDGWSLFSKMKTGSSDRQSPYEDSEVPFFSEEYAYHDYINASTIMASIGPGALPWLERALEDDLAIVRARACRNIGALGEAAVAALPKLAAMFDESEDIVRMEAARAYLHLAPEGDSEIARAVAVLKSFESD